MLSADTITKVEYTELNKHNLGVLPQGSKLIVCIPADKNTSAYKDNGVGTATTFDESIMGCNGLSITINNKQYKLYGEFMTVSGQMYIYIK